MGFTITDWATATSDAYDKASGKSEIGANVVSDDKLNLQEFARMMRELNGNNIPDWVINALFSAVAGEDGLIESGEYDRLTGFLNKINDLFDPTFTVADFLKQAAGRVGLLDGQMQSVLSGLSSTDLASTMKATTAVQQLSTILSQILKLVGTFQDAQNKAVDMRS